MSKTSRSRPKARPSSPTRSTPRPTASMPCIRAGAPWVVISPERRMLTTMKVIADMLWVMPPASAPQSSAENRLPVHRLAVLRSCRLANNFRFSVRSHIPTTNRPSPPVTPAKSSLMPVCILPTLLRSRRRTANSRADSVPVIPRRRKLACKSSQYPFYSQ